MSSFLRRSAGILLAVLLAIESAAAVNLSGTIFEQVGREANIDPKLLYAVALAESAYSSESNRYVAPHPWVLRTPAGPFYGKSREEAEAELRRVLKRTEAVDIGLMQINWKWHKRNVKRPEELLDPLTNVRTAARILNTEMRATPESLIDAVGRYHSREPRRSASYGLTVVNIYKALLNDEAIP